MNKIYEVTVDVANELLPTQWYIEYNVNTDPFLEHYSTMEEVFASLNFNSMIYWGNNYNPSYPLYFYLYIGDDPYRSWNVTETSMNLYDAILSEFEVELPINCIKESRSSYLAFQYIPLEIENIEEMIYLSFCGVELE